MKDAFLSRTNWVIVCLLLGMLITATVAEAKTVVTREYPKSGDTVFNIVARVLPQMGYQKVTMSRKTTAFTFVGGYSREMELHITNKGWGRAYECCSVDITGSAWFSNEPKEIAEKVHAEIKAEIKEAFRRSGEFTTNQEYWTKEQKEMWEQEEMKDKEHGGHLLRLLDDCKSDCERMRDEYTKRDCRDRCDVEFWARLPVGDP